MNERPPDRVLLPIENDPLPAIETMLPRKDHPGNDEQRDHLLELFTNKISFLRGKLVDQVFKITDWSPVAGLDRHSLKGNMQEADRRVLEFLISAGAGEADLQYPDEPQHIDPWLPGMRYSSRNLSKIPDFKIGEHTYRFAIREYIVVDPSEIEEMPLDLHYRVGPIGEHSCEVGVIRLQNN